MLLDGDEVILKNAGRRWATSWHPAAACPQGVAHGSAGICVTDTNEIVLISSDGVTWDFPAGRPEQHESWEQTLRREMLEEACAVVIDASLLGFSRGRCIEGREEGLILVRAIWRANVRLLEWDPKFEIRHRRLVSFADALDSADTYRAVWERAFREAALA